MFELSYLMVDATVCPACEFSRKYCNIYAYACICIINIFIVSQRSLQYNGLPQRHMKYILRAKSDRTTVGTIKMRFIHDPHSCSRNRTDMAVGRKIGRTIFQNFITPHTSSYNIYSKQFSTMPSQR